MMKEVQGDMMAMQLKRQLAMQNEMRERMVTMQIGIARERLNYYQLFYWLVAPACIIGAVKKGPHLFGPVVPLSFAYAFQSDMAYGLPFIGKEPLMNRARGHAEKILSDTDPYLKYSVIDLPNGLPTLDDICKKSGTEK